MIYLLTKLNVNESLLKSHVNKQNKLELVYKNVNNDVNENFDEFSKDYTDNVERELGLNKDRFPITTKEEIYYQLLPCVELSYKHMLTNTIHEFTIVNFFDNPEIFFHSEPEQLKQDLGNATKAVGGFFGKLFKTKGFKSKVDKRNEIVLLIHLAKVDGKIEDDEKIFDALAAGASGYILKKTKPAELVAAIRDLYEGGAPMSGQIASRVVASFRKKEENRETVLLENLSTREYEILELLVKGRLYKEISATLGISQETVRKHVYNIYKKLHVNNRVEAYNKFYGNGDSNH